MIPKKEPSALWLVDKPRGVTSFSLVESFRAAHPGPHRLKVMHGGALDPFAQGLVMLLVGAATRLFERLHEVPKRYVATVSWGRETDTCDAGGKTVSEQDASTLTAVRLEAVLSQHAGWLFQVPPATSNKRVQGERAYLKAHRGEEVTLPPSRVFLSSARWLNHALPQSSELELVCRGGFYVRSFARDLGRTLGCGAHLSALTRSSIGPYETPVSGPVSVYGAQVLPWLESRLLTDAELGDVRRGRGISPGRTEPPTWPLPPGFPPAPRLIRCFHRERLVALLDGAAVHTLFPGGI